MIIAKLAATPIAATHEMVFIIFIEIFILYAALYATPRRVSACFDPPSLIRDYIIYYVLQTEKVSSLFIEET
jgi:hypothetical protein